MSGNIYRLPAVLLAVVLVANAALAQQNLKSRFLEEIVVTADLKKRNLLNVPSSVGIVSEELIERRSAKHLEDVLQSLANVQASAGSSRARFYHIRGIGEREQYASPLNSSVGLLIDDVDFSGAGGAGTLFDVEQVEVLRGPQGTRYGAGALAGLINVRSREPTPTFEGFVEQELANYGGSSTGVALGGPIKVGRLLFRLALQSNTGDGFIYNEHLRNRNVNEFAETSFRGKLRWLLYEDLRVDFHFGVIDTDNGYDAFSLDNNRITRSDEPGRDEQYSAFGGAKLNWSLDFADLTAILNYGDTAIDYGYDEDWTYDGFHPDGYTATDRYQRWRETLSLETRLVHALPDAEGSNGRRIGWLAGAYLFDKKVALLRSYSELPEAFTSRYETEQIALFGELEFGLRDNLTLSLGGRAESWTAGYDDSAKVRFNPSDILWGAHLTLQGYRPSGAYWYAKIARASKVGGFNIDGSLAEELRSYGAEELYNFELGMRHIWHDRNVQTEVTAFHMERKRVQISSSAAIPNPQQTGASTFVEFIGNAAAGTNTGMEIATSWAPNERWLLNWQIGLLATRYSGYINAEGDTLSGRDQGLAPNWQVNLVLEHYWGDWTFRYELQASDGFYFSDGHQQRARSHSLNHVWLGLDKDTWKIAFWVRNFTNRSVQTRGFFFANDPRVGYENRLYYQLGEPRRIGATLTINFGSTSSG